MTRVTEATPDGVVRLENRFADGAAFIEGAYVPIAEARIPILDWGFTRSDVTYDVVHVWGGKFFRLDHHLDRFEKSLASVRMSIPHERDEVVEILMRLMRLSQLRDAYVEVLCTRGMPPKGTRDPRACENRFIAFAIPFVWIADEEMRARGINLYLSSYLRIPPGSVDPTAKNFHWGDMIRALFESYERGCDMPVVVDLDGNIAEGPGFNVFAVKGGTATTPGGTCLEGITRRTALDLLGELNVKGEVGTVSPDDLRGADEVFVTSTAGGILPVTKIDHEPVGDGATGPVTERLRDLYWVRHEDDREATPIDYEG